MPRQALQQAIVSLAIILVIGVSANCVSSTTFTITNNCWFTVWPGILSSGGSPALDSTGFALAPGESRPLQAPGGWSGRVWGRTLCAADAATGRFACATGDCGSGRPECAGHGAAPPATLAEFTLDGHGGMDFYDVSLVDGYNLPVLVEPQCAVAGRGACVPTGCTVDLNGACPAELRMGAAGGGGAVACRSACEAFGSAEHCCSGEHGSPDTCRPSAYSQFFKNACPRAYSYAYDDATSTFTCGGDGRGTSYAITVCPSTTSLKSVGSEHQVHVGGGGGQVGSSSWRAAPPFSPGIVLLGVACLVLASVF